MRSKQYENQDAFSQVREFKADQRWMGKFKLFFDSNYWKSKDDVFSTIGDFFHRHHEIYICLWKGSEMKIDIQKQILLEKKTLNDPISISVFSHLNDEQTGLA